MAWGMGSSQVEDHGHTAGAYTPSNITDRRHAVRYLATVARDEDDFRLLLSALGLKPEEGRAVDPWTIAAYSKLTKGRVDVDDDDHLAQHPICKRIGKQDHVILKGSGRRIDFERAIWPCEVADELGG